MNFGFLGIFFYFSLKGESVYQYEGDRTRDDIVNFALRLVGPSVNQIESKEDFEDAKSKVIYKGILSTFTILQLLQTMLAIPIWFPLRKYFWKKSTIQKMQFRITLFPYIMLNKLKLPIFYWFCYQYPLISYLGQIEG